MSMFLSTHILACAPDMIRREETDEGEEVIVNKKAPWYSVEQIFLLLAWFDRLIS
jgi:hypothetical protein